VQNHPFNDTNKRTGFGAAYLFLKANNVNILFNDKSFESLVIEVAKGKKTKKEITYFFEHGQNG
jgi:death-on-curing protein